jgi:hypothetical protein
MMVHQVKVKRGADMSDFKYTRADHERSKPLDREGNPISFEAMTAHFANLKATVKGTAKKQRRQKPNLKPLGLRPTGAQKNAGLDGNSPQTKSEDRSKKYNINVAESPEPHWEAFKEVLEKCHNEPPLTETKQDDLQVPEYLFLRRGVYGTAAIHEYLEAVKPEDFGLSRDTIVKAVGGDQKAFEAMWEKITSASLHTSQTNFFQYLSAEILVRYGRGGGQSYLNWLKAELKIEKSEIEQAVRKHEKRVVIIDRSARHPNIINDAIAKELSVHQGTVAAVRKSADVRQEIEKLKAELAKRAPPTIR